MLTIDIQNFFGIIPSLRYSEQVVYARRDGRYHQTSGKLASRRPHRNGPSAPPASTGATADRAAPSGARTQRSQYAAILLSPGSLPAPFTWPRPWVAGSRAFLSSRFLRDARHTGGPRAAASTRET